MPGDDNRGQAKSPVSSEHEMHAAHLQEFSRGGIISGTDLQTTTPINARDRVQMGKLYGRSIRNLAVTVGRNNGLSHDGDGDRHPCCLVIIDIVCLMLLIVSVGCPLRLLVSLSQTKFFCCSAHSGAWELLLQTELDLAAFWETEALAENHS